MTFHFPKGTFTVTSIISSVFLPGHDSATIQEQKERLWPYFLLLVWLIEKLFLPKYFAFEIVHSGPNNSLMLTQREQCPWHTPHHVTLRVMDEALPLSDVCELAETWLKDITATWYNTVSHCCDASVKWALFTAPLLVFHLSVTLVSVAH